MCPWNETFATRLREPAFAAREAIAGKDARTLARDILAMDDEGFRTSFKGSPMKRAKLRGLKRNAAVVLGNVGSDEDAPVLVAALRDSEPLARAHAAWALGRIGSDDAATPLRERLAVEADAAVREELEAALAALAR